MNRVSLNPRRLRISMKRIAIVAVVGCAVLLIYAYSAIGQNQTQAIQGQRIGRGSDSSRVGALPDADAPVPIRSIDGVTTVRDGDYTIDDPRPLEQATKLLERKLGVPIWYEDPQWAFSGDLIQAADLPANRELVAKNPSWRGPLVPRGGSMSLTLPTTLSEFKAAHPIKLFETAIASHGQLRNSATFKVVQFGENEFSIVGIRAASKEGRLVDQVPPLDRRITFPAADRTLADTLKLICDSINVRLMVEFRGGPEKSRHVMIGSNNEVAREVLARAMRLPGGMKISWVLSYMPDLQAYLLGSRAAQAEIMNANGTELQTLYWPK